MNTINVQYFKSPFGELIIGATKDSLCLCDWNYRKMRRQIDNRIQTGLAAEYIESSSPIISKTMQQLEEYAKGDRKHFEIPLRFVGTDFQKEVWQRLLKIPYGKTETYGALAHRVHYPEAVRAVAAAVGANCISIIVPCHRIIGSDGKLVGYAGGLPTKQKLLELEDPQQLSLF